MHEEIVETPEGIEPLNELETLIADFSGTAITGIVAVDNDFVVLANSDNTQQFAVGQLLSDDDIRSAILQGSSTARQVINPAVNARRWRMIEPIYSTTSPQTVVGALIMESNIEAIYTQVTEITIIWRSHSSDWNRVDQKLRCTE